MLSINKIRIIITCPETTFAEKPEFSVRTYFFDI